MMPIMIAVFALLLVSQFFLFKNKPNTPAGIQQARTATAPAVATEAASASTPEQPSVAGTTPVATASTETETAVENDLYRIVFTNRGAQAKHWILKKYKDDKGQPLDLVNASTANLGLPLSLYAYDDALRNKINSALYVGSASGAVACSRRVDVRILRRHGRGPQDSAFRRDLRRVAGNRGHCGRQAGSGLSRRGLRDSVTRERLPSFAAAKHRLFAGDKVERLAAKKISGGNTLRGPFQWAGPQDQYFAAIFLPDCPQQAAMVTFRNTIEVPKDPSKPDPNSLTKVEILGAAVGSVDGVTRERIFVGPKALGSSARQSMPTR